MNKLEEIVRVKRAEIEQLRPCAETFRKAVLKRINFRNFRSAISSRAEKLALIAEVKKAAPSAGVIAPSFAPVQIAKNYARRRRSNFGVDG